jgi:hypothetical protein
MNILRACVIALLLPLSSAPALAQSLNNVWAGTPVNRGDALFTVSASIGCALPNSPAMPGPPCPAGTHLVGNSNGVPATTFFTSLPAGVDQDSGFAVSILGGTIRSDLCPNGYCNISSAVPISAFANSSSVNAALAALQSQSAASASSFNTALAAVQTQAAGQAAQAEQHA